MWVPQSIHEHSPYLIPARVHDESDEMRHAERAKQKAGLEKFSVKGWFRAGRGCSLPKESYARDETRPDRHRRTQAESVPLPQTRTLP